MAVGKLVPVPKKGCHPENKGMYRGIDVQSVLGQLVDCVMHARAGPYVEEAGLRAPVQCGFRQEYGTLDALFTMQHLITNSVLVPVLEVGVVAFVGRCIHAVNSNNNNNLSKYYTPSESWSGVCASVRLGCHYLQVNTGRW
jgi:hypothetical protein